MFDMTLKHFSEVKTIHIIDTAQHKDALTSRLAGVNAIAHITIDSIISRLNEGDLIGNLIADADTIDLSVLAWPTPEPLSSDPSKPTRYPIEAWDGLLQKIIKKIAYYQQVPDAMAGQCILGALAHMGQAHVDAPIGYKHMPASLILITEGESGSGKTQAMELSHHKIKEYEQKQYEEYITRHEEHKAQIASLKGVELKDYLANEPAPHNPERLFKDATIEPVLDKFVNGEITDASWSTDDAAQFFNGHTMKGDTAGNALAAITDLYSGGEVNRTRSQKNAYANPRTKAYNVRMTLMLMAQRIILEPALTDDMMNQQGFLARALIACPNSLQGYRTWDDIERRQQSPHLDSDLQAYWSRCSDLLDPVDSNAPTDDKGAPKRYKMRWQDKQTEQVFYEHMQAIEDQQAKNMPLEYLKAYASRMAENASRIATLIAFFDKRKTITTDDIKRAFMLVNYSTAERLRYQDATPTGEQTDIEKLSIWLIDKAKGKNPAVLNKSFVTQHAPNALRGKKLNYLLDDLESMGHIRLESEGRRRLVYVNPKLIND
jgi:histone H3/H4